MTKFTKIIVGETLERDVREVLRQIVADGKTEGRLYGKNAKLRVVIGGHPKHAVAVFTAPPDLKEQVTELIYVIQD